MDRPKIEELKKEFYSKRSVYSSIIIELIEWIEILEGGIKLMGEKNAKSNKTPKKDKG